MERKGIPLPCKFLWARELVFCQQGKCAFFCLTLPISPSTGMTSGIPYGATQALSVKQWLWVSLSRWGWIFRGLLGCGGNHYMGFLLHCGIFFIILSGIDNWQIPNSHTKLTKSCPHISNPMGLLWILQSLLKLESKSQLMPCPTNWSNRNQARPSKETVWMAATWVNKKMYAVCKASPLVTLWDP